MHLQRSLGCFLLIVLTVAIVGCKRAAERVTSTPTMTIVQLEAVPSSPLATPSIPQAVAYMTPAADVVAGQVSPVELPTVTPTPTATFSPTPSVTPTPTPSATSFPTLQPAALLPESIAQMAVREVVASGTNYTLTQISRTPLGVADVEWSPDGQHLWLAMAAGHAGMGFVPAAGVVMHRDGGSSWLVSRVDEDSEAHDWSPDGQQLVFSRAGKVWVAAADGKGQRTLPLPDDLWLVNSPRYSADGNTIAAVMGNHSNPVRYDLLLIDPDADTTEILLEDVQPNVPAWSPTGDALAMLSDGDLVTVDLVSNQVTAVYLTKFPGTDACCQHPPTWVLDGTKLLATIMLTPGVWLVDRDGQIERLDQRHPVALGRRPPGLAAPRPGGRMGIARASANGDYVAYTDGMGPLYVLDLRSNREISTTTGSNVVWSPTEPYFARWGQGVNIVDARNGVVRQIAPHGEQPAWSPDSTRLAYWQFTPEQDILWVANLADNQSPQVMFTANHSGIRPAEWPYYYQMTPRWSPDGEALTFIFPADGLPQVYLLELHESGIDAH